MCPNACAKLLVAHLRTKTKGRDVVGAQSMMMMGQVQNVPNQVVVVEVVPVSVEAQIHGEMIMDFQKHHIGNATQTE